MKSYIVTYRINEYDESHLPHLSGAYSSLEEAQAECRDLQEAGYAWPCITDEQGRVSYLPAHADFTKFQSI